MPHSSLHVCMDSSDHDWLHQGTMSEEISKGLDSGGGEPLTERRLRPTHDQNLKCPRCDSTYTKFCYYNNYNLSQPRYFCKTCRRYWTKGGTLRNIPVGGGCRKNKKSTSKKSNNNDQHHHSISQSGGGDGGGCGGSAGLGLALSNPNDLHLSFPQVQFPPHLVNLIGAQMSLGDVGFMGNKYEGLVGGNNVGHDFMGGNENGSHDFGVIGGMIGDHNVGNNGGYNGLFSTFGGINICSSNTSPCGLSSTHDQIINHGNSGIHFMDQRLLLPFDENTTTTNNHHQIGVDVKPKPKLLSLEWQDQGCYSDVAKDSFYGYNVNDNTNSSWNDMRGSGFQPSTTNSLV